MGIKIIAKNKRASYDYLIKEKFEAGLMLQGTEVKSLRLGKCTIAESHVMIDKNGEAWLHNMTIPQYEFGNINNHEETRKRKLLLNKKELSYLFHQMQAGGLTIVATHIYFKDSYVKIGIALGQGKKLHDKRNAQKDKDAQRKLQRGDYT